jgi:hypothetical protein
VTASYLTPRRPRLGEPTAEDVAFAWRRLSFHWKELIVERANLRSIPVHEYIRERYRHVQRVLYRKAAANDS